MYRIKNKINTDAANETGSQGLELEIYLYNEIVHDKFDSGFSAGKLISQIAGQKIDKINLHVNSEGGDLLESFAVANVLRDTGANITAIIDGICASAASIIAMSADKVVMHSNSIMMIHNPFTIAIGDSEEMAHVSEVLAMLTGKAVEAYAAKTGLSTDTVKDLMNKESWMDARMCKSLGFCDEILDDPEPEPERKAEPRYENSAKLASITSTYKPVDKTEQAIDFMANVINQRRK